MDSAAERTKEGPGAPSAPASLADEWVVDLATGRVIRRPHARHSASTATPVGGLSLNAERPVL